MSVYDLDPASIDLNFDADHTVDTVYVANRVRVINDAEVEASNNQTAFGELQVANLTPVAGWTFAYNVNTDLVTPAVTGSGTVTHSDNFAVLSTTAATSSTAQISTILPVRYIPGQGALARFTAIFTPGVAGSTQLIGVGNSEDGLFFGYNGTDFGILRRRAGVDTWVTQANWDSKVDGVDTDWINALDFTKGNVFEIQFQWLGFGQQNFLIENPSTGKLQKVHVIEYANANVETSIFNPTLPVLAYAENDTNDTNIVLKTPSAMGFCEGNIFNPEPPHPLSLNRTLTNTKTGITTETNILTLHNKTTWSGVNNRARVQLRNISVATEGTKAVIVKLIKNTTLGGTPSYSDYNAVTSPIEYDTAGTTITGGQVVHAFVLSKEDAHVENLDTYGIYLNPDERLTISATSDSATEVLAAINWVDLI